MHKKIKIYLLILGLQLAASGGKLKAQSYWQQEVDYTIDVSLNDTEHNLDGFIRMVYSNHSPDTLTYIWIHCWPNAYKNDQTAFSEQLLGNGRTDFYFSDKDRKGYINHLDFRVDGITAKMEDHPRYIDIIKIVLPRPLLPGNSITITTPFHEQLPYPFSRSGYTKGSWQVAQWYPQPAVYDRKGWHPIPYLDQGAPYGEFGSFDVRITLPQNYTVAATGIPSSADDLSDTSPIQNSSNTQHNPTKTLRFRQNNITSFAWFAGLHLRTDHDTLQLPSGRIIDVYAHYTPAAEQVWKYSTAYIKNAVRLRSSLIGEYPYDIISLTELPGSGPIAASGNQSPSAISSGFLTASGAIITRAMSYPTLAGIPPVSSPAALELAIQRAVGYNWFGAALGPDERDYPWMAEGINRYYDRRYKALKYPPASTSAQPVSQTQPALQTQVAPARQPRNKPLLRTHQQHDPPAWIKNRLPEDPALPLINTLAIERRDQPVSTSAEDFTALNYNLIAKAKTALWLHQLEDTLGTPLFDSCLQEYFRRWTFRHPYPEDFRAVMEQTASRNLAAPFALLDTTGPVNKSTLPKKIRLTFLFSARKTDRYNYINLAPAIGYNTYDHLMAGVLIHNFNHPPSPFQFALAPMYATNSHQLNGAGYLGYSWYPRSHFQKMTLSLEGAKFSFLSGNDSNQHQLFGGFYKIAPSLRITLKNKTARSTVQKWFEWKTFLIGEKILTNYVQKSTDSLYYPAAVGKYDFRYLNQLSFNIEDNRVLYPYKALLQVQQGARFYRINFTGNYFFNYAAGGGLNLRLFAAKFGYIGDRSSSLDLSLYQPKLTAVSGSEDYTYSNYFVGRHEFTGLASQQIMTRDGGLKIRLASFPFLEGRSDNWVSAINLNSTLPSSIVPKALPLKVFLDIGTYAAAWQDNPPTSRFLYTAGLQLSLFHNILNIYAPILYSSDFRDQLKTLPDQNSFLKKLSFSIDIQNLFQHNSPGTIPGSNPSPF